MQLIKIGDRTLTHSFNQCAWCVPQNRALEQQEPYQGTHPTARGATQCLRHRTLTHNLNQCTWCVPQKSISGAVGATLGNAPYGYKIAICYAVPSASHQGCYPVPSTSHQLWSITIEFTYILDRSGKMSGTTICYTLSFFVS